MKVALVHDWLFHMRGGEKVLECLAEIYPDATIYTLFYHREGLSPSLQRMKITGSFLQRIPGIVRIYRMLLPILPWVMRRLKIEEADLVISSSHCVAKGIRIPEGARHICYCHTPMRYVWGFEEEYFGRYPGFLRPIIRLLKERLRAWDLETNSKVDWFIANSNNVKQRIAEYYQRDAVVLHPPVDMSKYRPMPGRGDYYLVVSAFVPYKRVDLVIDSFNSLDRPLVIVGSGPMAASYRNLRRSAKISFVGGVSDCELRKLYAQARALIFPTFEDFGIVPLEAQACGTPVIALGKGWALESVKSGVFFPEQTPQSLREAVLQFENLQFDTEEIVSKVRNFDRDHFKREFEKIAADFRNK